MTVERRDRESLVRRGLEEFNVATFGNQSHLGKVRHLAAEAQEAYEAGRDFNADPDGDGRLAAYVEELVDCQFLVWSTFDKLKRDGHVTPELWTGMLEAKLDKLKARNWSHTGDPDLPVEHDRSGEDTDLRVALRGAMGTAAQGAPRERAEDVAEREISDLLASWAEGSPVPWTQRVLELKSFCRVREFEPRLAHWLVASRQHRMTDEEIREQQESLARGFSKS